MAAHRCHTRLGDGEDFELILAVSPDVARHMLDEQPLGVPLTVIGEFDSRARLVANQETPAVNRSHSP